MNLAGAGRAVREGRGADGAGDAGDAAAGRGRRPPADARAAAAQEGDPRSTRRPHGAGRQFNSMKITLEMVFGQFLDTF